MGPFIDNLEGRIQMPSGCGEQNIATMTPALFAGSYLKAINRMDDDTRRKTQKVLAYGSAYLCLCTAYYKYILIADVSLRNFLFTLRRKFDPQPSSIT